MEDIPFRFMGLAGQEIHSPLVFTIFAIGFIFVAMFLHSSKKRPDKYQPLKDLKSNEHMPRNLYIPVNLKSLDYPEIKSQAFLRSLTLSRATLISDDKTLVCGSIFELEVGDDAQFKKQISNTKIKILDKKLVENSKESWVLDVKLFRNGS